MLVAMAVWFFRKRRVVKIYLDNRESFSKDNIYYSSVNKKYFLQKMKEWHVELEDNKPEEIPPWKEQIQYVDKDCNITRQGPSDQDHP